MDTIGTIGLSKYSEVIFYIDTYKGDEFANIRKFVKSKRYTGPTKSGVKLTKRQLEILCKALSKIPGDLEGASEGEFARIPVSENWFIWVGINYFNGEYGLDIRQYLQTEKYTGPSKKGVRLPLDYLGDTMGYCRKMLGVITNRKERGSATIIEQDANVEGSPEGKRTSVEGVPDEYSRYF